MNPGDPPKCQVPSPGPSAPAVGRVGGVEAGSGKVADDQPSGCSVFPGHSQLWDMQPQQEESIWGMGLISKLKESALVTTLNWLQHEEWQQASLQTASVSPLTFISHIELQSLPCQPQGLPALGSCLHQKLYQCTPWVLACLHFWSAHSFPVPEPLWHK